MKTIKKMDTNYYCDVQFLELNHEIYEENIIIIVSDMNEVIFNQMNTVHITCDTTTISFIGIQRNPLRNEIDTGNGVMVP
jgi:hypothetical protein